MPKKSPLQYVDPTLGVGRGNCLIGPYRPLALVRVGPDCDGAIPSTTGYTTGKPVIGFSHLHMSGTGGIGRYGNIRLMPFTGDIRTYDVVPFFQPPFARSVDAVLADESARVGYYRARQAAFGVGIELTSSEHVGVHRYRFDAGEAKLMIDVGATIRKMLAPPGERCLFQDWEQCPVSTGGYLEMVGARTLRGRGDFRGGWGNFAPHSVYFQIEFDQPIRKAYWANAHGVVPAGIMKTVQGERCHGVFDFGAVAELNCRVGISMVSVANAEGYLRTESDGQSFEDIVRGTERAWERIFERYSLEGGTEEAHTIFNTMLYRLYSMPVDLGVDQENPLWKSGVRAFDNYCCLWDSVRNANSYFTLFDPLLARDLMNNLLDIAEHSDGWLPDAFIANRHAYMQSANAGAVVFSEAARKGLEGVDYSKALRFLRKDSEDVSPDPMVAGRWLEDWKKLGYLSTNIPKGGVSRHIEYAFYDWCVARLAEQLGEKETAKNYDRFAGQIWNLWEPDKKVFFARSPDGMFVEGFNPWRSGVESYNDKLCYESPSVAWAMSVFHDFPGLIERLGGPAGFRERLDYLFAEKVWYLKETMMHIPHLYTLIGAPDSSAERVAEALKESYKVDRNGLRDDEDFGCQSGFYLWNSVGLYPVIGHTIYFLTPPLFDTMTLRTGSGTLSVSACRKEGSRYIQGVKLNGKTLNRAWLRHEELCGDVRLEFFLCDVRPDFGRSELPF